MKSKKIWLLTLSLFCMLGCETMQIASRPNSIQGNECIGSPYMKILQVVDDGVLAHICPTNYPSYYSDAFEACVLKGDTVYMEVPKEQNYFVDDQKITLAKSQCFVRNGTFSYTSADGRRRTVRNIVILEEEAKPEGLKKTRQ